MPTTVKTGWLQDKNGDKFAPKTLTSQVQTNDGILIEDKIQTDLESVKTYINTKLSELPDPVVNPDVASVGQTLVVKEVDENGKPVKWESADYQPRTHWDEEVETLPETTAEFDTETGVFNIPIIPDFSLIHGQEYIVVYNGSEYSCQAMYMEDAGHKGYILGNYLAFEGTGDTGHPFLISIVTDLLLGVCAPLDGSTSVTLSIKGSKPVTIPPKYLPEGVGYDEEVILLPETTAEVDAELGAAVFQDFAIEAEKEYTVIYNGVEYTGVECIDTGPMLALGNLGAVDEYAPATEHPFVLAREAIADDENEKFIFVWGCIPLDGSTSVTLSIKGSKTVTIPLKYLPKGIGYDEENVVLAETAIIFEKGQAEISSPPLSVGQTYEVTYNGVKYNCVAINGAEMHEEAAGTVLLGNVSFILGTGNTGEPFVVQDMTAMEDAGFVGVMDLMGATGATISIKELKTVTISPKYLPDGIGYEEDVYILPKTTLINTGNGLTTTLSQPLVVGEAYKITYNGSEYVCKAHDSLVAIGEPGLVVLGNIDLGMGTGDTGEPFAAVYLPDEQTLGFEDINGVGVITVSISQSQVRTIPHKYMPSSVPFDESVVLVPETTPTIIKDDDSGVAVGDAGLVIVSDVKFIPNETYEVMYAGTKYTCTARAFLGEELEGAVVIGNFALIGMENTGEPFMMLTVPTEAAVVVFPLHSYSSATLPTVSITQVKFQKISARCLPDNVGGLGLPKVSADDNGAILRVVDGTWSITRLPSVEEEGEF